MARNAAVSIENNFSKGLITEATGLNFPENSCTETYDCVFEEKGKVRRRLGFGYESDYLLNGLSTSNTDKVIKSFVWENVAGQGDLTFAVIQFGSTLMLFETSSSLGMSNNLKFSIDLNTYKVSGAPSPESKACAFAAGNGALFVTHPYCEPFFCSYNPDTQTHTETAISLKIRDFDGVEDSLDVQNRPTTLSSEHKYNLYNQGWADSVNCANSNSQSTNNATLQNPVTFYKTFTGKYPSNADVWWTSKQAYDFFYTTGLDSISRGNTRAPQGHFLLNPFYQDRTAASGIAGLTVHSSGYQRPAVCSFHANRLFMGGIQADDYSNKIYFTQIIKDDDQYGRCYQQNDPTAEDINDLLPTDGGVIAVLAAGQIIHLHSVEGFLVVFATNGVWAISGGSEGKAFAANEYSINKISDVPTQSAQSFVSVNGVPLWWTNDGIYGLQFDPVQGKVQIQSISDKTIKSFFDAIPESSKARAQGSFNTRTKVVQWVYRSTAGTGIADGQQFDRVLNLNTLSGAFYPWRISSFDASEGPWISGILSTKGLGVIRQSETVTDNNGVTVTNSTAETVTVSATTTQYLTAAFRYITIAKVAGTYNLTFSQDNNANYLDWASIDYDSYVMSGFKIHGQATVRFQTNYLNFYMDTETDASCFLEAWWDYTSTRDSGRVSNQQQVYKDNDDFSLSRRRLKIRGNGLALQFRLFSESMKPFTIVGWSGFETGNTQP